MNNDINEKIVHAAPVPPFVRFVASAVPMVFDNSLSYYEALCALWKWMQDNLVDVINHNASVTEDYIEYDLHTRELFVELKSYVDNYFDNLDVQEEINNKLDDMVEAGTLQEIITTYIQSNVAWTFDTVADMKQATNLVDGSYARTLGFHSLNDGGGALYKITNTGTANEIDVIAIGDLRASLIIGEHANVMQFGAYGDNTNDDSAVLQYVLANFDDVFIPDKQFAYATTLQVTRSNQIIKCNGLLNYSGSEAAIKFVSGVDDDIFIRKISSNAIGLLIQPSAACGRNTVTVDVIDSQAECFKVIGQYSTSSWYLYGLRWNSIANYAINMEIPTGSTGIFYNRFMFHNMALLAHPSNDTKGILLTDLGGTGTEMQVQFTEVNFENVKGIRTSGKVGYLSINNCRLTEIANTDWLEFNGMIPNTVISGAGRVYLSRIKFQNITSGEQIVLNIRVQDASSYSYSGGVIVRADNTNFIFVPNDNANTHYTYVGENDSNTIGDEATRDATLAYVLPQRIRITNTNASTTMNVPNWFYNNKALVMLQVATNTTVTLKYGTGTVGTLAGNKNYAVFNQGSFAKYVELS